MATEITLRPGVVFRDEVNGAGTIELPAGRRIENVRLLGTVPGSNGEGPPVPVRVLSAVFPVAPDQVVRLERLPAMAVVPVETEYLRSDRDILFALFQIPFAMEGDRLLDPARTVVLPMHGASDVDESGHMSGGRPCLPVLGDGCWISLAPQAVAIIVGWVRGPDGQLPDALVNTGCFSSTPQGGASPSFNAELAALLAPEGVTVYGPPYAGVVTSATWHGAWRNQFRQNACTAGVTADAPIKFVRIGPAVSPPTATRRRAERPDGHRAGALVVTNDAALAAELAAYSPDFAAPRPHGIERALME